MAKAKVKIKKSIPHAEVVAGSGKVPAAGKAPAGPFLSTLSLGAQKVPSADSIADQVHLTEMAKEKEKSMTAEVVGDSYAPSKAKVKHSKKPDIQQLIDEIEAEGFDSFKKKHAKGK